MSKIVSAARGFQAPLQQRTTAVASRAGSGFLVFPKWQLTLTIGTNFAASRGYNRAGGWGALSPDAWASVDIDVLQITNTDTSRLQFAGDVQINGATVLRVATTVPDAAGGELVWNAGNGWYAGNIGEGVFDYLDANIGGQILIKIARVQ